MPFARPSLQQIKDGVLADVDGRLEGADSRPRRAVVNVLATAWAGALYGLYFYLDWISRQVLVVSAEGPELELHSKKWGPSRQLAAPAAGSVSVTGTTGAAVPAGAVLRRADGVEYRVTAGATLAAGAAAVTVQAASAGLDTNAEAGIGLAFVSPVDGVQSQALVAAGGLVGGADAESDTSLRSRILRRIQNPPHGGNASDYLAWALARDAHGIPVTRAWVAAREMGLGTVTVRIMLDETYPDGIPQAGQVAAVQAYIDGQAVRPVTAEVFVVAPIAAPLDVTIEDLSPDTPEVRAAAEAEIAAAIVEKAAPGGTIKRSWIWEAVSRATGETSHTVAAPAADVAHAAGEIAVPGTVTFTSS